MSSLKMHLSDIIQKEGDNMILKKNKVTSPTQTNISYAQNLIYVAQR